MTCVVVSCGSGLVGDSVGLSRVRPFRIGCGWVACVASSIVGLWMAFRPVIFSFARSLFAVVLLFFFFFFVPELSFCCFCESFCLWDWQKMR